MEKVCIAYSSEADKWKVKSLIMTPQELLNFFIEIAPQFAEQWNSERNFSVRNDKTFTFHGVCSQFSYYFVDRKSFVETSLIERKVNPDITLPNLKKLFNFIEENIYSFEVEDELDNALCTCFLEDIAKTKAGDYARNFMGKKSKKYYDSWNI